VQAAASGAYDRLRTGILKPSGAVFGKPIRAVRTEIVIVHPLAVRNDWRPGALTAQWYLESHLHREELTSSFWEPKGFQRLHRDETNLDDDASAFLTPSGLSALEVRVRGERSGENHEDDFHANFIPESLAEGLCFTLQFLGTL
jgi:hypothetical protein